MVVERRLKELIVMLLAYFDPGAGSLLMQALVGGLGGFAVLGRYLWSQWVHRAPLQVHQTTAKSAE
jgi:hypothetical protein